MPANLLSVYLDKLRLERAKLAEERLGRREGTQFDYGLACGEQQALGRAERILLDIIKDEKERDEQ